MADNEKSSWHWPTHKDLRTASGMKIMTLFGSTVKHLVVELKKTLLLYNLESLEENVVNVGGTREGGTIAGVLEMKNILYVVDSRGVFYEISPDTAFQSKPLSSSDSGGETVCVKLFAGGYLSIVKENNECFLSVHWIKNNSNVKIKIPVPDTKDINRSSCVIAVCKWCDLSTELTLGLLTKNIKAECEDGEIAFVTVGNGALYYTQVPPRLGNDSKPLNIEFLFQCDLQPISGIFCLKDEASDKYTRIALLQPSGMVESISYERSPTDLSVMTTYVPCEVHCYAEVSNRTLVCSDTKTLWRTVIPLDSNEVCFKHKKYVVKGVRLVAAYADEEVVVILTNRGRFHHRALCDLAEMDVDCAELEAEIEQSEARYSELQRQLEAKREMVWVQSIVARESVLRETLVIAAKVSEELVQGLRVAQIENTPKSLNEHGDYLLNIKLVNNSGVVFAAKLWSLQLIFTKQDTDSREIRSIDLVNDFGTQSLKIEQKIRMGSFTRLRIDCRLISRLEDQESPGFFMINTSSLDMDTSYFFAPTEEEGVYDFSSVETLDVHNMLEKLKEEARSGCRAAETATQPRRLVYHLHEHVYKVMLPNGLDHRRVWLKILENSLCKVPSTFVDDMQRRDGDNGLLQLRVLVGTRLVRFKLDDSCSTLTIKCHDLVMLHSVKDAVLKLLAALGSARLAKEAIEKIQMDKEEDVVAFQGRHQHLTELENLRAWRKEVTTFIPV